MSDGTAILGLWQPIVRELIVRTRMISPYYWSGAPWTEAWYRAAVGGVGEQP